MNGAKRSSAMLLSWRGRPLDYLQALEIQDSEQAQAFFGLLVAGHLLDNPGHTLAYAWETQTSNLRYFLSSSDREKTDRVADLFRQVWDSDQQKVVTSDWPSIVEHRAIDTLESYAAMRQKAAQRGEESPALSALLVEKFAAGQSAAITCVFDDSPMASAITSVADRLVVEIDPAFAIHREKRWAARPAGLNFESSENV